MPSACVGGRYIIGLVSLADLQKLPVRAVLFALITGFEIAMMEAIGRTYKSKSDWLNALSPERRNKIEIEKKKSEEVDALVTPYCSHSLLIKIHL